MMKLAVTLLIEDLPGNNPLLKNEHGLSFFIEKDGLNMLFDTGQSSAFLHNAGILKADPASIEYLFLSHGHYDHTGGVEALCNLAGNLNVVTGSNFFRKKYSISDTGYSFKGNSFSEAYFSGKGIKHREVKSGIEEIIPGVFAITDFDRTHDVEGVNEKYVVDSGDSFEIDRFTDEIVLAFDTPKGLIVLSGCSHPGIMNILDTVKKRTGKPLYAFLGGTHLIEADSVRIRETLNYFDSSSLNYLGACHCTGEKGRKELQALTDKYVEIKTGSTFLLYLQE